MVSDQEPLIASVGNERVDEIIRRAVAAYRDAFPSDDLSYYLIGSWVDGPTNDLSDIDMIVVWPHGRPSNVDLKKGESVRRSLRTPIRLDIAMLAEQDVPASHVGVNLKLDSLLLYGVDIQHRVPLPSMESYIRGVCDAAYFFIARILRGVDRVAFPLEYPEHVGEFYGYDRKRIKEWYPLSVDQGLKELVSTGTRIATALVAVRARRYVGSKCSAITMYREVVGDEWSDYLETIYRKGKVEWAYLIPNSESERQILRDLCSEFLFLEQHFLKTVGR